MEVREMRNFLTNKYPSGIIRGVRIKDMPEKQVMAIYFRITNSTPKPKKNSSYHQVTLGEYDPPKKKEAIEYAWEEGEKDFSPKIQFTQMNLFDIMKDN